MPCKQEFSYDIDMNASAYAQCKDVYIPDFDVEVEAKGRITGCRLVPVKQDGCAKSCKYRLKVDYQIDPYVKVCGPKRGHANFDVVVNAHSKVGCARPKEEPCRRRPEPCKQKQKQCRKENSRRDHEHSERDSERHEHRRRACRRHLRLDCKKCH